MPAGAEMIFGQANRFQVVVDDGDVKDLGRWEKCDGLSVTFKKKEVKEGDTYSHVHYLMERVNWDKIKLVRAINPNDTQKVFRWMQKKARDMTPCTAAITVLDHALQPVFTWTLEGVYPEQWSVPGLDAGSGKIAREQLTLVHQGFLGL
jgi:phage tail-like protein